MKKVSFLTPILKPTCRKTELTIVIEIKYYIFSTNRLNGTLSTTAFKNRLKYTILALKEIAIKNGKLDSFKVQWNTLCNTLL